METVNQPLVTLTDSAVEKVKSMMTKEGKEGYALRFGVVTGGCAGLSYEMKFQKNPYENDIAFEQKGLKIIINQESVEFVKGVEIDYVDTLRESGFKYSNPGAKSSCGCGTSFS
ncbi:MAG: iron-sulfur cluster assembly accessory protein [Candidatus Omnitrophica bacterium]|nr:iron-sulfur cluster assembly accessory protein [Candidatus Omnitrophota bacterium]